MNAWLEELKKLKAARDEATAKKSAAERLAKAWGKVATRAARTFEESQDLCFRGEPRPPAGQARLFEDDPLEAAVEDALRDLLGDAYRTPAAIAAEKPTVDQVVGTHAVGVERTVPTPGSPAFVESSEFAVFDADGFPVVTEAGAKTLGRAIQEAIAGPGVELVVDALTPGGREVLTPEQKREIEESMSTLAGGPIKLNLIDAGTREPRATDDELARSLRAALHRIQGCEARWAAAIENGEDDAALRTTIGYEFGPGPGPGGGAGPGGVSYSVKCGDSPKFWHGFGATGKPTLEGKALVQAVRELLGVPLPYGKTPPKPRKSTAKLAGASKVPTATVEAPDEAERVGCGKPAGGWPSSPSEDNPDVSKPAEAPAEEDWSDLWRSNWRHSTTVMLRRSPVVVESKYTPSRHGRAAKFEFGDPLASAGYGEYGLDVEGEHGIPAVVPAAFANRPHEYVDRLVRHLLSLTGKGPTEVLADIAAPAWRSAPLAAVSRLTKPARDVLARCGVKTIGDLVDAIELGVEDCRIDPEDGFTPLMPKPAWEGVVAAVDRYLDEVPGRRPAKPDEAEPAGPSETAIHEALKEALWPEGVEPIWRAKREEGMSDGEVLAELTRIWPRTYLFVEGPEGSPGWTIQGAGWPSFRLGGHVVGPNAAPVSKPLFGAELARAVRHVMRIPDSAEPTSAKAKAEKAKAKKPRKKGAAV